MTPRIVEVTWIDGAFHRGWGSRDEKRRSMRVSHCRTVGYLLVSTPEHVTIVQSLGDDDSMADGIAIPRVAVKRMRTLE